MKSEAGGEAGFKVMVGCMGNEYDDEYIQALEKQVEILVHHLQVICLDVGAIPSSRDIYGSGAREMIESIEPFGSRRVQQKKRLMSTLK